MSVLLYYNIESREGFRMWMCSPQTESELAIYSIISCEVDFNSAFGRDKGLSETTEVKIIYVTIPWTPEKTTTYFSSSMHNYRGRGPLEWEGDLFGFDVFDTSLPRESLENYRKGRIMLSKTMGFMWAFLLLIWNYQDTN